MTNDDAVIDWLLATTFKVLENARHATDRGIVDARAFEAAEARAIEFMLAHRLYRSDKTGKVISERFTHLTYPGTGTTRSCAASTICG